MPWHRFGQSADRSAHSKEASKFKLHHYPNPLFYETSLLKIVNSSLCREKAIKLLHRGAGVEHRQPDRNVNSAEAVPAKIQAHRGVKVGPLFENTFVNAVGLRPLVSEC